VVAVGGECIRGVALCRPLINVPPIHRLWVSSDELRILRLHGDPIVARRSRDGVRFARWLGRSLFFLVTEDCALVTDLAFVPWSGRRLSRTLERHGWEPIEDPAILRLWPGFIDF